MNDYMLTEHFSYYEFVRSSKATSLNLLNRPNVAHLMAMHTLCRNVLEPWRLLCNASSMSSFTITSGFRNKVLNKAARGVWNSQHTKGEAADVVPSGMPTYEAFDVLVHSSIPYDQAILEIRPNGNNWIHVSGKAFGNRGETMIFDGTNYRNYLPGGN